MRHNYLWLLTFVLHGCGVLAGDDYLGEPLMTLSGQIVNPMAVPTPEDAEVALVWIRPSDVDTDPNTLTNEDFRLVSQVVPVTGEFPAAFQLQVFHPPPEEGLTTYPSASFGVAVILVLRAGVSDRATELSPNDILGMVGDHGVAYAAGFDAAERRAIGVENGFNLWGFDMAGIATTRACIQDTCTSTCGMPATSGEELAACQSACPDLDVDACIDRCGGRKECMLDCPIGSCGPLGVSWPTQVSFSTLLTATLVAESPTCLFVTDPLNCPAIGN